MSPEAVIVELVGTAKCSCFSASIYCVNFKTLPKKIREMLARISVFFSVFVLSCKYFAISLKVFMKDKECVWWSLLQLIVRGAKFSFKYAWKNFDLEKNTRY